MGVAWFASALFFCFCAICSHISLGDDTCQDPDDGALLQVSVPEAEPWQSPRDLAKVSPPQQINLTDTVHLTIFSAVPTFGRDGNYIALLREPILNYQAQAPSEKLMEHLQHNDLFCTGVNRSHRSKLRVTPAKTNLLCDWPAEEAEKGSFQIFVENAEGKVLGQFTAQHQPGLLQQYGTVACVRDIFVDEDPKHVSEIFSGPFKQLVEWLEFHHLHGVDHFLVYTFKGTDEAAKDPLTPYLKSGLASRIHFQHYPVVTLIRQHYVVNDCLYRAKSHAKWLLTAVDIDEYIHMTSGQIFPGGTVPLNYLQSSWDAIAKHTGKDINKILTIKFNRRAVVSSQNVSVFFLLSPLKAVIDKNDTLN